MNSSKTVKIVNVLLALILCFMFVVSIVDSKEVRYDTNFSQDNMLTHIEKLSENGPRSIIDKEANDKAIEYIVKQIEGWGVINEDTTDAPAYIVQDYVATDDTGRYQNFYLQNVIVHIPANAANTTDEALNY